MSQLAAQAEVPVTGAALRNRASMLGLRRMNAHIRQRRPLTAEGRRDQVSAVLWSEACTCFYLQGVL